ncbi:hypothetical protein KQX54_012493 [Cotesia glomerata]|uniref:Ubiquitin-like domain-containing protein n=1 Tax=Cotesia glomerata TaxID=32391 RepID=A0AAV7IKX9_COTGL|nr:hypothetical protein KQX54_012493 [Cotesia glomerata]
MQLIIRGQDTFLVECQDSELVFNLKNKIAKAQAFGDTEFTLSCNGHLLADDTPSVSQLAGHLDLNVPLFGGVHFTRDFKP